MSVSRRQFCTAAAGLFASGTALGTASAQASLELSGMVRSEGDGDPTGTDIRFSHASVDERAEATVGQNGEFSVVLSETGTYRVTTFDESPERDGVPVVSSFDPRSITEEGDLGEFVLPEAHEVSLRFVDADGNPVSGLPVNFRAANGTGASPGLFTTDSEGYTKYRGATETGVELAGQTQVELQQRGEPPTPVQSVFVTDSTELEFSVENPTRYGGSVGDSGGGRDGSVQRPADDGERERGLFSNSGDEPEFVSDPLNLTTAGFLLSVAGITYQLFDGR